MTGAGIDASQNEEGYAVVYTVLGTSAFTLPMVAFGARAPAGLASSMGPLGRVGDGDNSTCPPAEVTLSPPAEVTLSPPQGSPCLRGIITCAWRQWGHPDPNFGPPDVPRWGHPVRTRLRGSRSCLACPTSPRAR